MPQAPKASPKLSDTAMTVTSAAGQPQAAAVKESGNTLAIVGLILAILLPLAGLIVSIIALRDIKKKQQSGSGLAVTGIVLSSVMLIIPFIIGVIAFLLLALVPADYPTSPSDFQEPPALRTTEV